MAYKSTKTMKVLGPVLFFMGIGIIAWKSSIWVALGLFLVIIGQGINLAETKIREANKDEN